MRSGFVALIVQVGFVVVATALSLAASADTQYTYTSDQFFGSASPSQYIQCNGNTTPAACPIINLDPRYAPSLSTADRLSVSFTVTNPLAPNTQYNGVEKDPNFRGWYFSVGSFNTLSAGYTWGYTIQPTTLITDSNAQIVYWATGVSASVPVCNIAPCPFTGPVAQINTSGDLRGGVVYLMDSAYAYAGGVSWAGLYQSGATEARSQCDSGSPSCALTVGAGWTATTLASQGNPSNADVPLPLWALALLGTGLAGGLSRRIHRAF